MGIIRPATLAVAGAGFSGAVLARQLAENSPHRIVVFDERAHLAGNCFTQRDASTGVMVHAYGPHIFNTNREDVWRYVRNFAEFIPYISRVKANTARGIFSLPINLLTLNQFFGKNMTPDEARDLLISLGDSSIGEPRNFEEQGLKTLGRDLYHTFYEGYTRKQWGCEPRELPASIFTRLPIRFDSNDNYYNTTYQGLPRHGYTSLVGALLNHPSIEVRLGESLTAAARDDFEHIFFTGPIDNWFEHRLGRLHYRTVTFERFEGEGDLQGHAIINYPREDVAFTRIHEHKHLAPWEEHARSVAFREFSKATGQNDTPFYPLRLADDRALFDRYAGLAQAEKGVSFLGRLGTYRYLNMDQVIAEALDFSGEVLQAWVDHQPVPAFPSVIRPLR